uniref:Uncharacterized protein n=1 Tax=Arundo donax TaxID=35708 RepID=A0A0A9EBF0_ARUDO
MLEKTNQISNITSKLVTFILRQYLYMYKEQVPLFSFSFAMQMANNGISVTRRCLVSSLAAFHKLTPALFDDVIILSFKVALPTTCSEESGCWLFSLLLGLAQIFIVRIDSLVNSRPERGSTCTRCATRGESLGTYGIRGEG